MKNILCENEKGCYMVVDQSQLIEVGYNLVLGVAEHREVEVFKDLLEVLEKYPDIDLPLQD